MRSTRRYPGSLRALAILLDMTRTHVPVLAGELIELLDPRPGDVAVDCTFGDGGHARLVAGPVGAGGAPPGGGRAPRAPGGVAGGARAGASGTRPPRGGRARPPGRPPG